MTKHKICGCIYRHVITEFYYFLIRPDIDIHIEYSLAPIPFSYFSVSVCAKRLSFTDPFNIHVLGEKDTAAKSK